MNSNKELITEGRKFVTDWPNVHSYTNGLALRLIEALEAAEVRVSILARALQGGALDMTDQMRSNAAVSADLEASSGEATK